MGQFDQHTPVLYDRENVAVLEDDWLGRGSCLLGPPAAGGWGLETRQADSARGAMTAGPALRARWAPKLRAQQLAAQVPLDDRRAQTAQEVPEARARSLSLWSGRVPHQLHLNGHSRRTVCRSRWLLSRCAWRQ